MFVHVNPEAYVFGETISTLKFAERVATIELGAARVNKEEIGKLKSARDDKEREAAHLRDATNRITSETRNARARSPLITTSLRFKPEARQEFSVDTCTSEKLIVWKAEKVSLSTVSARAV